MVEQLSSRRKEAVIYGTLAMLYSSAKRFDDACEHYGQAIERAREVQDLSYHAVLEGNWGTLLMRHGDLNAAQDKLDRAINTCDGIWPAGAGSFRGALAQVRALQGDIDTAHALLSRGKEQLVDINIPALGIHYLYWAEVEHIAGDAEARNHALSEARTVEALLSKDGPTELTRQIAESEARMGVHPIPPQISSN